MSGEFARTLSDGRAGFPALLDAIEAHLTDSGVPLGTSAQLMIAFDEIISNALDHGSERHVPTVEVRFAVGDAGVTGEVSDDGTPFDPLATAAPDTSLSVEDRTIGGLGIHLVRKLMDELAYSHEAGKNRLRFSKTFSVD
jgi:serine/threonine-protein kinase RsbW